MVFKRLCKGGSGRGYMQVAQYHSILCAMADLRQFSQMPLLDKVTVKNPVLLWLNRRGWFKNENPLLQITQGHFNERRNIWEREQNDEAGRKTLVDRFLTAEKENPEKVQMRPSSHALTMVTAGSETT